VEGLDIESDVSTEKQDYEVEKIQESPGDKKPVEEEQKAGRDETETGIEQEITEDLKEVDTHQVENEEKPEEPYSSIPDKYSTE